MSCRDENNEKRKKREISMDSRVVKKYEVRLARKKKDPIPEMVDGDTLLRLLKDAIPCN